MDKFFVDNLRPVERSIGPVVDVPALRKLSSAAGYLSCAHDDLVAAGYDKFGDEVNHLIETLAAEISWLNVARNEGESP